MSSLKITSVLTLVMLIGATPLAFAQTTLGGNAKDNSASGGAENGTTEGAGKGSMMKGGGEMKSDKMPTGSMSEGSNAPVENQMSKGSNSSANGR